jgi:hypothetical protein
MIKTELEVSFVTRVNVARHTDTCAAVARSGCRTEVKVLFTTPHDDLYK